MKKQLWSYVCWLPDDARSQDISSHDIDLILMEYSALCRFEVNADTA